jgi:hypothetical protein
MDATPTLVFPDDTGQLCHRLSRFYALASLADSLNGNAISPSLYQYHSLFPSLSSKLSATYVPRPNNSYKNCWDALCTAYTRLRNSTDKDDTTRDFFIKYHYERQKLLDTNLEMALNDDINSTLFWATCSALADRPESLSDIGLNAVTINDPSIEISEMFIKHDFRNTDIIFVKSGDFKVNFPSHSDTLNAWMRQFFRPSNEVLANVENTISSIAKGSDITIGVHIRYGDYREWAGGNYYFDISIYKQSMALIRSALAPRHIRFVVTSNETLNEAEFDDLDVILAKGNLLEDLFLLSRCDLILGPISSFNRWAAFLGQRPLINLWRTGKEVYLTKIGYPLNPFEISDDQSPSPLDEVFKNGSVIDLRQVIQII